MSGLVCGVCGKPWKLDAPLLYHFGQLHCSTFACSRECEECKDDFEAIEDGAPQEVKKQEPKSGELTKAPGGTTGYAEVMKRLKGG